MVTKNNFSNFLDGRFYTLRPYYQDKIENICELLNKHNITPEELHNKCIYNETSKDYYSLYDLIVDALCPPSSLIEDRINGIRKRNIGL